MITTITSGGHYERAVQFYFCSGSFATARWTRRLDPGRERSSVTATQACLELGGDPGGDGQALAQDGQKRRWWTRLALAGGLVCALGGLDGCQAARFAADGALRGGERGGAIVSRHRGSTLAAGARSLEHRTGASLLGCSGLAGGQRIDRGRGHAPGLWSGGDGVLRHDCAGARHRLSERGWDYAWSGAARLSQPGESERERPGSGRGREREGERALQDGQRVPSVCQDPRAERSPPASTRCADQGVDRAQPGGDQAGGPQRRENDPIGGQENGADGRGEGHLAAADHAMASDRSSGEGQGRARRDYHGAGHCQKQGGQTRGVWVEVADQSHRRGVCFGEGSRSGCGRASNADRSDERVSASFRGESSPEDERLRSWRERTENDRGVETAGRREGRHPTARESQMVRCRGRPARSAQPAREDRGSDRHAQESEVRFQSPNREKPRNVRGCWAAGDGLSEFEQADEGRRRERKESESSNSLKQEEARRRESTEEERREKRGKEEKEAAKGQK